MKTIMEENKLQPKAENKPEKKKLKKEDIIGLVFGISLAWSIGLGGFIPYIIGTFFGIWLTRKMLNSQKTYIKVIFWVLFVVIFIVGSIIHGMRFNSNYSYSGSSSGLQADDIKLLETDKSSDTSQISGNLYRNTKYHFRIKFPEGWKIGVGDGIHIVQKASFENSTISIIVQQFDLGGEEGFSSIKDAGTAKEVIDTSVEGATEKFSDVKIIDYGETKIDNEPAYWVEYSASSQVLDYKLKMTNLVYFLAKGDTMYSISAGTATDDYSKIKPLFLQSVSTFVLENY